MINNRMTEGVGKKIVDALKKQSDIDIIQPTTNENYTTNDEPVILGKESMPAFEFLEDAATKNSEASMSYEDFSNVHNQASSQFQLNSEKETLSNIDTQIKSNNDILSNDFEDIELPANVEVLRQLITKIPSNVSKQTGAQIIKQTMEALGISMKGVLQEAQQAQEKLNISARECQNNIAEYKRQINILENQTHKLHRQYSMLNDIISLFIQAGN